MSRTHRQAEIGWCKKCNKPFNTYKVKVVKSGKDVCNDHINGHHNPIWKIVKVWDHNYGPDVKPYQEYWNRKHRTHSNIKTHEMVKEYNTNKNVNDSYTFPIQRNQAKWDVW